MFLLQRRGRLTWLAGYGVGLSGDIFHKRFPLSAQPAKTKVCVRCHLLQLDSRKKFDILGNVLSCRESDRTIYTPIYTCFVLLLFLFCVVCSIYFKKC